MCITPIATLVKYISGSFSSLLISYCVSDQSGMLGVCHQHLYNAAKHLIWQISPAMATRHRGQQTMLHTPWKQDGGRRPEDRVVGLLLVYGETQKG